MKFPYTRILQFNIEDELGAYIDKIRGKDIVELARRINANTLVIFARDAWGRAFYNSKIMPKHSKLRGRDLLKEVVDEAKKNNIHVIVMIAHTTNPILYSEHPEWAQRNVRGEVITMDTDPLSIKKRRIRWPLLCLNSPFLQHTLEELREVLNYEIDGVFLDSFRYMPDYDRACYCKYCEEAYRREFNREMPRGEDWENEEYRKLFEWRYKVNVKAIAKIYEHLKKLNNKLILVYNNHPAGWRGRANRIVEEARDYVDVVYAECSEADYQPPGFISEMVKLTLAMCGGKPVWASRNSFHTCLTTTTTTPVIIRQGLREAFIAGGYPLYLVFSSAFIQDPEVEKGVDKVFREIEVLEEFMDGAKPVKYAGILFSNRSRDWGGRNNPFKIDDCFRGFYYALSWNNIPVTYISDRDLEEGKVEGFKVLVLANCMSISRKQVKTLHRLVEEGVGMVATYLTSIMDEKGRWLEEFQLREILGVSFMGVIKHPWTYIKIVEQHEVVDNIEKKLILWGDFDREFIDKRTPEELAWHTRIRIVGEQYKTIAKIVEPIAEYGNEYENGRSPPIAGKTLDSPAIVVGENGKSRIVYFTGQIGRLFWRIGLPAYEKLILNSIRWAGGKPPVEAEANGLIQVESYRRERTYIIHILNQTYDRMIRVSRNVAIQRGWIGTCESIHPPRRTIPLSNIKILVRNVRGKKAFSPISKREFKVENVKEGVVIKIDKIEEYEAVILET